MTRRKDPGLGDGDYCPLNPEHGQMFFLVHNQWCPSTEHDGRIKTDPQGPAPATRAYWPKGTDALRKAVIQTTMQEIDITLLGG